MSDIFKNIDNKNKEKLLKTLYADSLHFNKNESIINMIKDDNILGYIVKGNIKIILNNINGNKIILDDLYENDIFSSSLNNLNNQSIDIITYAETDIIFIDYNSIINYDNYSKVYSIFMKNLFIIFYEKLNERNERIDILTKKTIRNKLLEYFEINYRKRGSINIYLPYSYNELASYLAVDRSAMSRELKNLKDEGFIKTNGKKITLLYK